MLLRGFEADPDRSAALALAIQAQHLGVERPALVLWAVTIEMRFAGAARDEPWAPLLNGYVYPVAASGRGLSGEVGVDELDDVGEAERAALDQVLMPVDLSEQLDLTRAQANASALRLAAHRIVAPTLAGADLAAELGAALRPPTRYLAARWGGFFLAAGDAEAEAIAGLIASTVVDHRGCPRGQVVELERWEWQEGDDDPSDQDPDDLIEDLADHAANVAALRAPAMLAGALLMRAWEVEALEVETAASRRARDAAGQSGWLVGPDEREAIELRARLVARGRSAPELHALARRARHRAHVYWKVDHGEVRDLRRAEMASREADLLHELARELESD